MGKMYFGISACSSNSSSLSPVLSSNTELSSTSYVFNWILGYIRTYVKLNFGKMNNFRLQHFFWSKMNFGLTDPYNAWNAELEGAR